MQIQLIKTATAKSLRLVQKIGTENKVFICIITNMSSANDQQYSCNSHALNQIRQ